LIKRCGVHVLILSSQVDMEKWEQTIALIILAACGAKGTNSDPDQNK